MEKITENLEAEPRRNRLYIQDANLEEIQVRYEDILPLIEYLKEYLRVTPKPN